MGNSVCHTIYLNKSKDMSHFEESQISHNNESFDRNNRNANVSTKQRRNTDITGKEVSAFEEEAFQQFSSKS